MSVEQRSERLSHLALVRREPFRRLSPAIIGLVTGGFVARLALELSGQPRPWPVIVILALLLMAAGAWVAYWLSRPGRWGSRESAWRTFWPLLFLTIYLLWPQRQPAVALWLLALTVLTTLLYGCRRKAESLSGRSATARHDPLAFWKKTVDALIFVSSVCLYIITTARDVLPADSGEFQIVAPLLGVAHPPGYPLYTLLGRFFVAFVPVATEAYRLNLMSAVLAAATLTLLGAATRRWARRLGATTPAAVIAGLTASVTLGTATTFWSQATVANIRMPTMAAASLGLYALARYADAADRPQADRALGLFAFALGLGIGHHPSLMFLGCFFLVYLICVDRRLLVQPGRWWKPVLLALVALLPVIYVPLRGAANPPLAPPDLNTLDGFLHHVTAQGFEGDMFAFANAHDLPQRLILVPTLFLFQFHPALLAAAALGLLVLAWRERRLFVLLAGGLILHTFVSITYRAPQTVEYLMPAYLPLAILVGLAVAWLLSTRLSLPAPVTTVLGAAILLAGLANGIDHAPSYFGLARDHSTRETVQPILEQAPAEALILADWHWVTPLWYLQWVEGVRTDVEVRYVWPIPGQQYADTWKDRIQEAGGERQVVLTHFYDLPDYTLEPLGMGFWLHQRPHFAAPVGMLPREGLFTRGDEQAGVRLLGYRLSDVQPNPGQTIELTLAWQTIGSLTASPSFSAKLLSSDGEQLAQADRSLGSGYTPEEIRFERLVLPLYPHVLPGEYQLVLEVYSSGELGFETWALQQGGTRLDLTTVSVRPDPATPLTLHPLDAPFAAGPALVGVDYDRSVPGTLRLYLHWRGPADGEEQIQVGDATVRLPVLPDGAYQTVVLDLPGQVTEGVRLRLAAANGQAHSVAGPWGWPLGAVCLPTPDVTARFVPLEDDMALIGVSSASGKTVALGSEWLVSPTFLALKPLINDYGVSVRLYDQAGQLRRMHDLQPALGTIPTLKWIRGSRVLDPHPLVVPQDIAGITVKATLVVYERFRGNPLLPLDGRLEEVPLGEWVVTR